MSNDDMGSKGGLPKKFTGALGSDDHQAYQASKSHTFWLIARHPGRPQAREHHHQKLQDIASYWKGSQARGASKKGVYRGSKGVTTYTYIKKHILAHNSGPWSPRGTRTRPNETRGCNLINGMGPKVIGWQKT